MKKLLIILSLLFTSSLFSDELAWVDEQIEAIKPPRNGMNTRAISGIKNPFIFLKKVDKDKKNTASPKAVSLLSPTKDVTKRKQVLTLSLILNNSAMINDVWYKKGDKVTGYEITEVNPKSVLLIKGKKKLLLSTKSSNKNLKFNNK